MPISLILTPFDHFHFRPALAVKCIHDLRICRKGSIEISWIWWGHHHCSPVGPHLEILVPIGTLYSFWSPFLQVKVPNLPLLYVVWQNSIQKWFVNNFLSNSIQKNYSFSSFQPNSIQKFIHIWVVQQNSIQQIIQLTVFWRNSIQKIVHLTVFRQNSIQKFIQKVEIGCIQFNKIFIQ